MGLTDVESHLLEASAVVGAGASLYGLVVCSLVAFASSY